MHHGVFPDYTFVGLHIVYWFPNVQITEITIAL